MEKVIWITGASSGIGEELSRQLSQQGYHLILSARNEQALARVKEHGAFPDKVKILPLDISDFSKVEAAAARAFGFWNRIDILINNAGISQRSLIAETDFSVYKKLVDVNYLGTVALTKALLPYFIKQEKGHFVVVSSLMGKFSSPYRSGYCGAKHALHGFFDALRMEHEKDGVNVTMVCPGFVQTNVAKNALTADGSHQEADDHATQNGMPVSLFCKKMIAAIQKKKFEVYIAGKEKKGVYVKRYFPKLLHQLVLRSDVR
ncbi:MAG: SDR family oxidoreductase [Bacteroidota bacterium]